MRLRKATAAVLRRPRPPRLPRVRLRQPSLHVTAMAGVAALVTAVAAASPSLQGSFVGANTPASPAAVVQGDAQSGAQSGGQGQDGAPVGAPTYTTIVRPPHTEVTIGPGNVATVMYTPSAASASGSAQPASPLASDGIPVTALEAYQDAANGINVTDPACHLPWPLLAAIGRVESDHGRFGGAVLRADGTSSKKIIGPALNGNGTEVITDTDHGRLDGDPIFDHAVGPMQFIPSTWATYGTDGNGDGIADPFNIFDAAAATAHYLCVAGGDLSTTAGQTRAVLAYNHSTAYLDEVLELERTYASNDPGLIIPAPPAVVPPVTGQQPGGGSVPPPVNPGPPLAGGTPGHPAPTPSGTRTSRPVGSPTGAPSTHTPSPSDSSTTGADKPGGSPTGSSPTGSSTTGSGATSPAPASSSPTSTTPSTTTPAPPACEPQSTGTATPATSDVASPASEPSAETAPAGSSTDPTASASSPVPSAALTCA